MQDLAVSTREFNALRKGAGMKWLSILTILLAATTVQADTSDITFFSGGKEVRLNFESLLGMTCKFECKEYKSEFLTLCAHAECPTHECKLVCYKRSCKHQQIEAAKAYVEALESGLNIVGGYDPERARKKLEEALMCKDDS